MADSSPFGAASLELAKVHVSVASPLRRALLDLALVASGALRVGRITIWRLVDSGHALRCECLYQHGLSLASDGAVLLARDFPSYVDAVREQRMVIVEDVVDGRVPGECRESYLTALGIGATIDAPVSDGGRPLGLVCHEHVGSARAWSDDDVAFAAHVASHVGRLYLEAHAAAAAEERSPAHQQADQLSSIALLGQLAAAVAHDFGNIFVAVQRQAESIAADDSAPAGIRRTASDMSRALESGRNLVASLRRLPGGQGAGAKVVDPSETLHRSLPLLRVAAGDTASVAIEAPPLGARVLIDPGELERALVNLVVNAREAMPAGGIVTCRVRPYIDGDPPGARMRIDIEVEDQGVGIPQGDLSLVCNPFFTTKGTEGSGLGLFIVHRTAVMAGGTVDISSARGVGTKVSLRLPAIQLA